MTPPGVEIRRLSAPDAAPYREIRLEALAINPEAFGSNLELEQAQPLDWFAERLVHSIRLGVLADGELVAIGGLVVGQGPKQAHKASIQGFYVRPQVRRRGIARRLLEALIESARPQGVEILQFAVMADNDPARRLYADLGFVEYGLEKHALKHQGRYYDDILMALHLSVMT